MTGDLHKEIRLVDNQYFAQAAERLASGTAVRLSVMGNSMLLMALDYIAVFISGM